MEWFRPARPTMVLVELQPALAPNRTPNRTVCMCVCVITVHNNSRNPFSVPKNGATGCLSFFPLNLVNTGVIPDISKKATTDRDNKKTEDYLILPVVDESMICPLMG